MLPEVPGKCPVCEGKMNVTELHCPKCNVTVRGTFALCKFCSLNDEMREFVEVFIKCRGNIKEVERELGISYPTVRSRLDKVIAALGYSLSSRSEEDVASERRQILTQLSNGDITAEEATKLLKQINY